jgi:hypothetical protein
VFTFQPPVSQSLATDAPTFGPTHSVKQKCWSSTKGDASGTPCSNSRPLDKDPNKGYRKTFVPGGAGAGFGRTPVLRELSGDIVSVHSPLPDPQSKLEEAKTIQTQGQRASLLVAAASTQPDWNEVDVLLSSTRLRVGVLPFSLIRGLFLSFQTSEQQLRFMKACSKDVHFNFVQVSQLCKDRPEIVSDIIAALSPSISSISERLTLLGNSAAPRVCHEVSPCLWFQSGNLSGWYHLDLMKPAHYRVAEDCLVVNAWESEVSRMLGYPDVSQKGNHEMLRNEVFNEAPFCYARDWNLPVQGVLHFDFSSIRRPPPTATALHEATEVIRFFQRNSTGHGPKIRALQAISTHLYMSAQQLRNLVSIFPAGQVRQDVFCMFHTRVVDPARLLGQEVFYNDSILSHEDRTALFKRVGAMHLLNPLHPEGIRYFCDLALYEQRKIVEFLIQLAAQEPGGRVLGAIAVSPQDKKLTFRPLPATWEKNVPSDEGCIICRYETNSANMQCRQSLAQKYSIGLFAARP